MANCRKCGKEIRVWEALSGLCDTCCSTQSRKESEAAALKSRKELDSITVTTEAYVGDVERLGVVASEVVLGMNIFRDILANVRDIFGGRSGTVQKTLEQAREIAFEDIRTKASRLGANAVIAVDIDYHSISTGSSVNMLMVSVSGTAIRMRDTNTDPSKP